MAASFELTTDDHERLAEIRSMKRTATLVLVGATVIFVFAHILETKSSSNWGYLRATAEAAMIGGVADWFAVTALFRHPLGIPIPHTAILPNRKDQLGKTLGSFVKTSFLAPELLTERMATFSVSEKLAEWLSVEANADLAAEKAGALAATVVQLIDEDDIGDLLTNDVLERLRNIDVAPLAGQIIDVITEDGRHHQVLDAALTAIADMLAEQKTIFRQRFEQESPWWVPEAVDEKVFDRIYAAINTFINEIRTNPDHEVRSHVDARVRDLAVRLRESPELAARANQIKNDMLTHPSVRDWAIDIWAGLRENVIAQSAEPDSALRKRLGLGAGTLANALNKDESLKARVDSGAAHVVSTMAGRYGDEVAGFVESTVQKWDATETSTRVEVLLGRDLQIIRINGSVVGGLVGLVIYSVSQFI